MSPEITSGPRIKQVKEYLLNYITQNQLKGQDQLPSETEFAKTLGVSRNTLREAYIELENEGVIIRRHGIGTFVSNSRVIRDSLNDFAPFSQLIHDSGFTPTFETISISEVVPPNEVNTAFLNPPDVQVCLIKRVVRADGQPVMYIEDYINPISGEEHLVWDSFDGNMVMFLSTSLNTPLHHIRSQIRAAALHPEFSQYLELESGTPILYVRSTIFKEDNQPVAFSRIYFNSNIVEMNTVRMIRTS
jgi:GntR family transcriptional regulator